MEQEPNLIDEYTLEPASSYFFNDKEFSKIEEARVNNSCSAGLQNWDEFEYYGSNYEANHKAYIRANYKTLSAINTTNKTESTSQSLPHRRGADLPHSQCADLPDEESEGAEEGNDYLSPDLEDFEYGNRYTYKPVSATNTSSTQIVSAINTYPTSKDYSQGIKDHGLINYKQSSHLDNLYWLNKHNQIVFENQHQSKPILQESPKEEIIFVEDSAVEKRAIKFCAERHIKAAALAIDEAIKVLNELRTKNIDRSEPIKLNLAYGICNDIELLKEELDKLII